eukprot:1481181-Karenia_brevis.AAC.1
MSVEPSTKRNQVQPFWWFGAAKGTAFGPVLDAQWNAEETQYQVKVPRPELRREHQGFEYPPKSKWVHETMVLTAVRREYSKDRAAFTEWHNYEVLLVDTVCWDYTMFHRVHSYDELRTGAHIDQRKIMLRRMRQWLGEHLVLTPVAEEELLEAERTSSWVPISGRLKDFQEPEFVDEVHNINSWAQYVTQVLGPRCDDPVYTL